MAALTGVRMVVLGAGLDLTEGRGLRAITEICLDAEFAALARRQGQQFRIRDTAANLLLEVTATDFASPRPEIERVQLRAMLLASPAADTVGGARTSMR